MTLAGQEELAAAIAGQVLEQLQPGCAPMIVPQWAADIFGRWAHSAGGTWQGRTQLYGPGPEVAEIEAQFTGNKTLSLQLSLNGQYRIWSGVLRGPGGEA